MITVDEADKIIMRSIRGFGIELISIEDAPGRVLAEPIIADRDLPPFNRVTMDGIAIKYSDVEKGIRNFKITGIQAAGDTPIQIGSGECIEIMTGCALPGSADTVIRYEDIEVKDGTATIGNIKIKRGQNIHCKGSDRNTGEILLKEGEV